MNPNEMIAKCLSEAQSELNKITCYESKPRLDLAYRRYEYVGNEFIEESEGDRGEIFRKTVADSPEKFIEYLLDTAVRRFAFSYECRHRRPFEDNRRQVNEIIQNCFACLDRKYEYTLMIKLKDNIHIYFDLLDYYVKVSKEYLDKHPVSGEAKRRLTFIATRQYAAKSGGMYDVAFSFEWVRYQIARILALKPELTELKTAFLAYEEQYERLKELEKKDPDNAEKYQLGTWDEAIFEKAEEIVQGSVVSTSDISASEASTSPVFKGLTAKYMAQKSVTTEKTTTENATNILQAQQCALYMLIVLVHTRRNVERDIETLITLAKTVDVAPFRKQLDELFVTDKYGVFHRGEFAESREYARKKINLEK